MSGYESSQEASEMCERCPSYTALLTKAGRRRPSHIALQTGNGWEMSLSHCSIDRKQVRDWVIWEASGHRDAQVGLGSLWK